MNGIHITQFDQARLDLITRNLITRVLTICHTKLKLSTSLEQKRFNLRSLSPALCNLWSLLVYLTSTPRARIGGFHVTSSPPCLWTVNKRSLISSFCLSTSICLFHHCYLCLPRLNENHQWANDSEAMRARGIIVLVKSN